MSLNHFLGLTNKFRCLNGEKEDYYYDRYSKNR